MDAAHTGPHLRPELQQLEANGRNGSIGELAVAQTDAARRYALGVGMVFHGDECHLRAYNAPGNASSARPRIGPESDGDFLTTLISQ